MTEAAIDKKLKYIKNHYRSIDPQKKELMLLHLKKESESINYDEGTLAVGSHLMTAYNTSNNNKKVVELGNELKKITVKYKTDTSGVISGIYEKNAVALLYLGLDNACRNDLKTALKYSESIKNQDIKNHRQSEIYEDAAGSFSNKPDNKKKERDSILYFLARSLETTKKIKNKDGYFNNIKPENIAFINVRLAIFYLEQATTKGSLEKAEKYLLESYNIYENKKYNLLPENKNVMLNQLSWLYMEKKDYKKSIGFAKKALELEEKYRNPKTRVESFEFLATGYLETGEKEKSKFYMNKYTTLKDSINMSLRNDADTTMKKMVKEAEAEHKESSKKQGIITGMLALIAGFVTVILWRRKNKALRRKYEQMMVKLKNDEVALPEETIEETDDQYIEIESSEDPLVAANRNSIAADTEVRILRRLKSFEKSEKFLKKDLTIGSLAAQLNTNTKYLSEIIKNNRSQNFNNYINSLRISYIVHKLYNEPKYREYKISYLAEECGYASSQVFVIAFKKINGLTPSFFIQNLKEDQVNTQVLEDIFS
jgi:AraC-like DNA-binding protein